MHNINHDGVKLILEKYFQYGFDRKIIRDCKRFRSYAVQDNISIPDDDSELKQAISDVGIELCGKIFPFSSELESQIGNAIQKIMDTNAQAVFYEPFMKELTPTLKAHNIYTLEMFKEYLLVRFKTLFFTEEYLTFHDMAGRNVVHDEIKRIWGEGNTMPHDEIINRLPYIPPEKIQACIMSNPDFIPTADGTIFIMTRFIITYQEKQNIIDFVQRSCESQGFASLMSVPCESIKYNNYELTGNGIYTAIFNTVLKGKFYRHRRIITATRNNLDITGVLRNYCRCRNECTLSEVEDYCREVADGLYMNGVLTALYDCLVRVGANKFVSDSSLEFDAPEIDRVIHLIMNGRKFIPLKNIASFSAFPFCGRKWNHYILESFCYRFSGAYELKLPGGRFSSRNIGVIAVKGLDMSYAQILAEALSRERFDLTEERAGKFLLSNGYAGKSKLAGLPAILRAAQRIREAGQNVFI